MTEKKEVSRLIRYGLYAVALIIIIEEFNYNLYYSYDAYNIGVAAGATIWTVIGAFVAICCASKCSKWASEIDGSPSLGYLIGFAFSLISLLPYWLFYMSKKKDHQKIAKLEEEMQALKGER